MEQEKKTLRDGRTFWTTHNGFIKNMTDKKGQTIQVGDEYYKKMLNIYKKENSKKQRNGKN